MNGVLLAAAYTLAVIALSVLVAEIAPRCGPLSDKGPAIGNAVLLYGCK